MSTFFGKLLPVVSLKHLPGTEDVHISLHITTGEPFGDRTSANLVIPLAVVAEMIGYGSLGLLETFDCDTKRSNEP